jgi:hypothetical protein
VQTPTKPQSISKLSEARRVEFEIRRDCGLSGTPGASVPLLRAKHVEFFGRFETFLYSAESGEFFKTDALRRPRELCTSLTVRTQRLRDAARIPTDTLPQRRRFVG